jgi:uncharacterized protein (DUF736 family)
MANKQETFVDPSIVSVLASQGGPVTQTDEFKELIKTLTLQAKLQLLRSTREEDKETAEAEIRMKSRKEGAMAMERGRQEEINRQLQCHHKKPNGESAVAGQRLHSHHIQYLCQTCSKEWRDGAIPLELRVPNERVGGPEF